MEFQIQPKEWDNIQLPPCRCGGSCQKNIYPIWDNPGDCQPTIDGYDYELKCDSCGITMTRDNPVDVIECWNIAMKCKNKPLCLIPCIVDGFGVALHPTCSFCEHIEKETGIKDTEVEVILKWLMKNNYIRGGNVIHRGAR